MKRDLIGLYCSVGLQQLVLDADTEVSKDTTQLQAFSAPKRKEDKS
jgi:hypothetical protein